MAAKFSARYVMAGRTKTRYIDVGLEAPVLVALHGGGAGSSGIAGMGKLAERLQGEMRVLAPDQVGGFGYTDPAAPTPHGSQNRVDHLADFAETMCLEKFHLVGNSQGAWVAARCDPYKDPIPEIPAEIVMETAQIYIAAFERITGQTFDYPDPSEPVLARVRRNLADCF